MPEGMFSDPDIDIIIRKNINSSSTIKYTKMSRLVYYLFTNPDSFLYEIRQGYMWEVTTVLKNAAYTFPLFIPCNKTIFSVDELNSQLPS